MKYRNRNLASWLKWWKSLVVTPSGPGAFLIFCFWKSWHTSSSQTVSAGGELGGRGEVIAGGAVCWVKSELERGLDVGWSNLQISVALHCVLHYIKIGTNKLAVHFLFRNLWATSSLQSSLFGNFFILTCIVFFVDVLSENDHLRSNLSHAHHTHLTHTWMTIIDYKYMDSAS